MESEFDESQRGSREVFKVLCEAAAAAKPGECSLDDPAFGQDFETFGLIGALDDFDVELTGALWRGLPEIAVLDSRRRQRAFSEMGTGRTASIEEGCRRRGPVYRLDERWRAAEDQAYRQEYAVSYP